MHLIKKYWFTSFNLGALLVIAISWSGDPQYDSGGIDLLLMLTLPLLGFMFLLAEGILELLFSTNAGWPSMAVLGLFLAALVDFVRINLCKWWKSHHRK